MKYQFEDTYDSLKRQEKASDNIQHSFAYQEQVLQTVNYGVDCQHWLPILPKQSAQQ